MQKPTCIELFAGAGGLSLGLEKANIDTNIFVEFNHDACETLRFNRPKWNIIEDDIKNISWENINIDIVTGGFPCQSFSYAGKRLGFEDTRGTLFYEFARCVKETKPKIFLAENVKGLLTHDKGNTLKTIIEVFEELGYEIQYNLLNAYDYGVPQKRERLIIIGTRKDMKIPFEWPQKEKEENKKTTKEVFQNCPNSLGIKYSEKKKEIMDLIPMGGNWRNLPKDKQKEYMGKAYYSGGGKTGIAKRLDINKPSPTIVCSPCQKQTERCHPFETRPINIRESARIQTFDDNWHFCGGISSQYTQIGNAVPVLLAQKLGEQLYAFIINNKEISQCEN